MFMNHWFMIMITHVVRFVFKFYSSVYQLIISREWPSRHVSVSCAKQRQVSIKCLNHWHGSRSYAYHPAYIRSINHVHLQSDSLLTKSCRATFGSCTQGVPYHLNYSLVAVKTMCTYHRYCINHRKDGNNIVSTTVKMALIVYIMSKQPSFICLHRCHRVINFCCNQIRSFQIMSSFHGIIRLIPVYVTIYDIIQVTLS